jgi:predicted ATP-dependent protease
MKALRTAPTIENLRWACPRRDVAKSSRPFDPTLGQERAIDALRTALHAPMPQHVYVSAADDSDRIPLVLALLERVSGRATAPASGSRSDVLHFESDPMSPSERVLVARDLSPEGLFGWLAPSANPARPHRATKGALLQADGRVLVVEVDALARSGPLWDDFRQALRDHAVILRARRGTDDATRPSLSVSTAARVVLVGREGTYADLFDQDPGFADIVPIKATLEPRARRSSRSIRNCAALAREFAARRGLRPLAASGLAAFVEESVRDAGRRGWISLRLGRMSRWLLEANQRAGERRSRRIEADDVLEARRRQASRMGVAERRVFEAVMEGIILIDVQGSAAGQVNGLAIHDYGNLGKVARITATVGPGPEGIVNVEREVALSGASYDKGVHILSGYLTELLGCTRAASLSVRLVFEQSYGHLTGDSATCAEACAVISALSGLPIRQDLAITGSMNQHGEVQAIGGVNEKIEGFYDLCVACGITGTQGVVIPRANVDDLMLRPDVVDACRQGLFRVHAIDRVEQGVALLCDRPAGVVGNDGRFTPGSVLAAAVDRLEFLCDLTRKAAWERLTSARPRAREA